METKENNLTKGNIYTLQNLQDSGCKFVKKTSLFIFYRCEEYLYVFDLKTFNLNGEFKLLSIMKD